MTADGDRIDLAGRYRRSTELFRRARSRIPLASQTFSKSHVQFPMGAAPLFVERGKGGRVWDVDGNEYVDLVSGLLPILLGYRDPDVDAAIRGQLDKGIVFSLATELEVALAERLCEMIPGAEMVRYGKNGSDATSAAVRLARAFTGRDRMAMCGYHGWQDWSIGTTSRNRGVPAAVQALTHTVPFNDIDALHALLKAHPGEFAGIIMEVMQGQPPRPGYLEAVRDLVHGHGGLLIFDEVISGFRAAAGGAQELYGVIPDLSAFGKAMGNGMPIAAVVGRADVMAEMEEIFFSTTFGGEALSLAAAVAVVDKVRREPVVEHLWRVGGRLRDGLVARLTEHGLVDAIAVNGLASWVILGFRDFAGTPAMVVKTLFQREMLARGVLINASHNVCFAHGDDDVAQVLAAYDHTLAVIADETRRGDVESRLGCPVVRPVFAVR